MDPSSSSSSSSTSANNNNNNAASSSTPQSRARVTVVCAECKRLKLKCDRRSPCGSCIKRDTTVRCQYSAAAAEKVDIHSVNNRLTNVEVHLSVVSGGAFQSSYPPANLGVGSTTTHSSQSQTQQPVYAPSSISQWPPPPLQSQPLQQRQQLPPPPLHYAATLPHSLNPQHDSLLLSSSTVESTWLDPLSSSLPTSDVKVKEEPTVGLTDLTPQTTSLTSLSTSSRLLPAFSIYIPPPSITLPGSSEESAAAFPFSQPSTSHSNTASTSSLTSLQTPQITPPLLALLPSSTRCEYFLTSAGEVLEARGLFGLFDSPKDKDRKGWKKFKRRAMRLVSSSSPSRPQSSTSTSLSRSHSGDASSSSSSSEDDEPSSTQPQPHPLDTSSSTTSTKPETDKEREKREAKERARRIYFGSAATGVPFSSTPGNPASGAVPPALALLAASAGRRSRPTSSSGSGSGSVSGSRRRGEGRPRRDVPGPGPGTGRDRDREREKESLTFFALVCAVLALGSQRSSTSSSSSTISTSSSSSPTSSQSTPSTNPNPNETPLFLYQLSQQALGVWDSCSSSSLSTVEGKEKEKERVEYVLGCLMGVQVLIGLGTPRGQGDGEEEQDMEVRGALKALIAKLITSVRALDIDQESSFTNSYSYEAQHENTGREKEREEWMRGLWWECVYWDTLLSDIYAFQPCVVLNAFSTQLPCSASASSTSFTTSHTAHPRSHSSSATPRPSGQQTDQTHGDEGGEGEEDEVMQPTDEEGQGGYDEFTNEVQMRNGNGKEKEKERERMTSEEEVYRGARYRLTQLIHAIKRRTTDASSSFSFASNPASMSMDVFAPQLPQSQPPHGGVNVMPPPLPPYSQGQGHGQGNRQVYCSTYTLDQACALEEAVRVWMDDLPSYLQLPGFASDLDDADAEGEGEGLDADGEDAHGEELDQLDAQDNIDPSLRTGASSKQAPSRKHVGYATDLSVLSNLMVLNIWMPFLRRQGGQQGGVPAIASQACVGAAQALVVSLKGFPITSSSTPTSPVLPTTLALINPSKILFDSIVILAHSAFANVSSRLTRDARTRKGVLEDLKSALQLCGDHQHLKMSERKKRILDGVKRRVDGKGSGGGMGQQRVSMGARMRQSQMPGQNQAQMQGQQSGMQGQMQSPGHHQQHQQQQQQQQTHQPSRPQGMKRKHDEVDYSNAPGANFPILQPHPAGGGLGSGGPGISEHHELADSQLSQGHQDHSQGHGMDQGAAAVSNADSISSGHTASSSASMYEFDLGSSGSVSATHVDDGGAAGYYHQFEGQSHEQPQPHQQLQLQQHHQEQQQHEHQQQQFLQDAIQVAQQQPQSGSVSADSGSGVDMSGMGDMIMHHPQPQLSRQHTATPSVSSVMPPSSRPQSHAHHRSNHPYDQSERHVRHSGHGREREHHSGHRDKDGGKKSSDSSSSASSRGSVSKVGIRKRENKGIPRKDSVVLSTATAATGSTPQSATSSMDAHIPSNPHVTAQNILMLKAQRDASAATSGHGVLPSGLTTPGPIPVSMSMPLPIPTSNPMLNMPLVESPLPLDQTDMMGGSVYNRSRSSSLSHVQTHHSQSQQSMSTPQIQYTDVGPPSFGGESLNVGMMDMQPPRKRQNTLEVPPQHRQHQRISPQPPTFGAGHSFEVGYSTAGFDNGNNSGNVDAGGYGNIGNSPFSTASSSPFAGVAGSPAGHPPNTPTFTASHQHQQQQHSQHHGQHHQPQPHQLTPPLFGPQPSTPSQSHSSTSMSAPTPAESPVNYFQSSAVAYGASSFDESQHHGGMPSMNLDHSMLSMPSTPVYDKAPGGFDAFAGHQRQINYSQHGQAMDVSGSVYGDGGGGGQQQQQQQHQQMVDWGASNSATPAPGGTRQYAWGNEYYS